MSGRKSARQDRTYRFVVEPGEPLQDLSDDRSPSRDVLRLTVHTQLDEVLQYAQAQPINW